MDKKPILVVPILHAEQDLPGLLAKATAGARVFLEKDQRLVAELRVLDARHDAPQIALKAIEPEAIAPAEVTEVGLGLRDRARELFLGSVPSQYLRKPRRRL